MTLKDQIWEAHPYMPRVKKLKLTRHLEESYEQVQVVCKHLGLPPPIAYDLSKCDITDDFLNIRDTDSQMIADAYIGLEREKVGLIVLPNGSQVTEHKYNLIKGQVPNDDGYIDSCRCSDCQNALMLRHEEMNEERTERYLKRAQKIRSVSDDLPEHIDAPRNVPPKPTIMLITSTTNGTNNEIRSTRYSD